MSRLFVRTACVLLTGATGFLLSKSTLQAAERPLDVLIAFKSTPGPAEAALVRSHGGTVKRSFTLVPAVSASIPAAAMEGLSRNPNITAVEIDGLFHAISTVDAAQLAAELNDTWGVKRVVNDVLHGEGTVGANIKVAIIDSGIDGSHQDLAANYAGGYDFVNSDDVPMDDNGHGTHVAGTVAAVRNGAGVVGVAPGAYLYALKVLGASGSGSFSNVIAALQWCRDNGIAITNNSYGSSQDPGTIVRQAFDNSAASGSLGILHIAAAGNSGNPPGTGNNVGYPARYDSVVAVAATNQSDGRASFSSTGPTVELAAPGVKIYSTLMGGGYVEYNGTSMASPHVAGVAALLRSLSTTTTASQLRKILQDSATELGAAGRDNHFGFGLVNAEKAVLALAGSGSSSGSSPGASGPITELKISDVASLKTHKNGQFEITWTTSPAATSEITFTSGAAGTYTDNTFKTSHRMVFKGGNGATYVYLVRGVSSDGARAESEPYTHRN